MTASFIYSPLFGEFFIKKNHPWYTSRSDATLQLCNRYQLLPKSFVNLPEPNFGTREQMAIFHQKEYLDLLIKANDNVFDLDMLAFGLGTMECPVFKGVFDYSALMVGASLLGAGLIIDNASNVVFSPSGGMHHAGPDFAAGFCYLNDIVLAIKQMTSQGLRVLYVDIDAHHGDQVQEAFYEDDAVFFLSFHESPKTLYPFVMGFETETGQGKGKGYNVNVPLMAETGDEVYLWAFKEIFPKAMEFFKPDVVVGVFGMDTMQTDPLTHLNLTNNATTEMVHIIAKSSPRLLAFGCGGYVLNNLSRGWTLAWAAMTGQELAHDAALTLGGVFIWDGDVSLLDSPFYTNSETMAITKAEAERVVGYINKEVFNQRT